MKHALHLILLTAAFSAPAFSQDCSKNSDACTSTPSRRSPFLEASAKPDGAARQAAKAVSKKSVKPAAPAPAAPAAVSAVAVAPATAAPETFSNPLWLLFAFGGLACLYVYLKSGKRGRRK